MTLSVHTKKTTAIETLIEHLQALYPLETACGLLAWDEQVNLPKGAAGHRAEELACLKALVHREFCSEKTRMLLEAARESLNADTPAHLKALVREAQKDFERNTRLPESFVREKALATSKSYNQWAQARQENNYALFITDLEKMLQLAKEEAALLGFENNPYDYWVDKHDPGFTQKSIESLFSTLKAELLPFSKIVLAAAEKAPKPPALRGFDKTKQRAFLDKLIPQLGFDLNHGRLDTAVHPFCGGNPLDTRLTTRFFEDTPLDSLFSTIHETGHGLYEQGLGKAYLGTPLAQAAGFGMHESQSRLWENQIGRSDAFWRYWEPHYRTLFEKELSGISPADFHRAISAVRRCPIRVDSDEVFYNLHILLRFELEIALFSGALSVQDLPHAWNQKAKELLSLTPKNDNEGVLQDVHWSCGYFGYFPSYCLGNMMAAQIWNTLLEAHPNTLEQLEKGNYSDILSFLRSRIHCYGRQFDERTLLKNACGTELDPWHLGRYIKERYGKLYGITHN